MAKLTRAMGNRQIDAVFSSLNTGKGIYASEDFDYIAGMAQLKREVKDLLKLTSDPEYRYWLNNLDISEYTKYFKKITELAETFRLQKANQMKDAEFLTLDELSSNFNQETKYDKRIDVINTFSLNDLQRWEKDYADKEAVLSAMIKTGFFESADSDTINKFLTSFSNRDRNAFIQRCFDSPDLLMSIFQKENIKSQKYLLALLLDFGTGSDTDKNTYEIPQGQVFNASFVDSKMYINYMKEVPYEDNMYELDKQVQLPTPFTNVSFFYGENNKITLPAISLIGNMDNRLYDDYYKCNTDISQLTDDEKKVLFDEFVDHYLGKAFIAEFLSNPLSLLKTVGLSLATGILLMFASEAVAVGLAIAGSGLGIISSSLDLKSGLEMLESVAELKKNARNVNDYKEAARLLAEAMVKISVNGIMLIVSLIQFGEACGKGFELYYKNKKLTVGKQKINQKINFKFNETNCRNHLIYGEGIKSGQGGVDGAHNRNSFIQTIRTKYETYYIKKGLKFNVQDCIESLTPHPLITGIEEVKYKLPALNQNDTLNVGVYKKVQNPKTIYNPKIIKDEQMLQWGKEAMMEAMKNNRVNGRVIQGYANNGLKFRGFINESGEISNFYPYL